MDSQLESISMKHRHHIIPLYTCTTCETSGIRKRDQHKIGFCPLQDPSNIVYLTPTEHAEAHKKLYEQYGREEDRIAYRGLAGIITNEQAISEMLSMAGKRGGLKGEKHPYYGKKRPDHSAKMKGRRMPHTLEHANNIARDWIVYTPEGNIIQTHNLKEFCRQQGWKDWNDSNLKGKAGYKGYRAVKVAA